ncbi:MAG: WYL domain-containing protein, partial [Acetobacter sp.]
HVVMIAWKRLSVRLPRLAAHGEKELSRAALDVLAKVTAVVPASLQQFISVPSTAAKLPLATSEGTVDRANLRAAIRTGTKLHLHYRDQQGKVTERTVWPVVLGYSDARCTLIAWCELRQGFRHFLTDRIHAVEILDEKIGEPRSRLLRRWKAQRTSELAKVTSEAG